MEVPTLPACLWPEGSEIMRVSLPVSADREMSFGVFLVVFLPRRLLC